MPGYWPLKWGTLTFITMNARTTDSQRVAAYRHMIDRFNQDDLTGVLNFVLDDFVYTVPGRSCLAGTTTGVVAHLDMLRLARRLTDGTLNLVPLATALDGDFLFVWGRLSARRNGRKLDCEHGVMYRFQGDKVVAGRTLPSDLYVFDDFWA